MKRKLKDDVYKFIKMNKPYIAYDKDDKIKYDKDYFTRIPNEFLSRDFINNSNLGKIFFVIYIEIDRNRTLYDDSYICVNDVFEACGYNVSPTSKPKIFYEIVKSLIFLKENNYIYFDIDPGEIGYNNFVRMHILPDNFDCTDNFTIIYWKNYHKILQSKNKLKRENVLLCFLSVCSSIGYEGNNKEESKNIRAFFKSTINFAEDVNLSRDTLNLCMKELVDSELLIKRKTGSVQVGDKPPKNVPNIYVLDEDGYEENIQKAYYSLLKIYNVEKFESAKGKINKKENKIGGIDVADEE